MSETRDHRDVQRDRNLRRIASVLELPPRADAQRRARWQGGVLSADGAPATEAVLPVEGSAATGGAVTPAYASSDEGRGSQGLATRRRYRGYGIATSGIAAAVMLGVWLTVGQGPSVSAATIFRDLAAALTRSLAIEIQGVDFGNARIDGDIVLDRDAPGGEAKYAEVHVLLRADNPEWNDLDCVVVRCETPEAGWSFTRGSGGAGTGEPFRVQPLERFSSGRAWGAFREAPLPFEGMFRSLTFRGSGSEVQYRFPPAQRDLTEALLRFLLDLSGPATGVEVVRDLEQAASTVEVVPGPGATHVLRASGFTRLGDLELTKPVEPDVTDLVRETVWELNYHPRSAQRGWGLFPPDALRKTGVDLLVHKAAEALPFDDPDALLAKLEEAAEKVEVERHAEDHWTIRVTGYPFETSAERLEWLGSNVQELRETLALEVTYDVEARTVLWARFVGFGGPAGEIRLRIGDVDIDPARLDPKRWTED